MCSLEHMIQACVFYRTHAIVYRSRYLKPTHSLRWCIFSLARPNFPVQSIVAGYLGSRFLYARFLVSIELPNPLVWKLASEMKIQFLVWGYQK
jgi:hypothetical protein